MVRVTGFACISFPLAGDAEKKSRYSTVCELVHAHVTDMCGHDSNPVTGKKREPSWGSRFLGNNADSDTKCSPGSQVGCILLCPGCIFQRWGAFASGGVHLDKLDLSLSMLF